MRISFDYSHLNRAASLLFAKLGKSLLYSEEEEASSSSIIGPLLFSTKIILLPGLYNSAAIASQLASIRWGDDRGGFGVVMDMPFYYTKLSINYPQEMENVRIKVFLLVKSCSDILLFLSAYYGWSFRGGYFYQIILSSEAEARE